MLEPPATLRVLNKSFGYVVRFGRLEGSWDIFAPSPRHRGERPLVLDWLLPAGSMVLELCGPLGDRGHTETHELQLEPGVVHEVVWWGDEAGDRNANCRHCGSEWDGKGSAPVGQFGANPFGLYDMNGNVWEWTNDCWNDNHQSAAEDGAARLTGNCERRVIRSGSWYYIPRLMSASSRDSHLAQLWSYNIGLRVVRELP